MTLKFLSTMMLVTAGFTQARLGGSSVNAYIVHNMNNCVCHQDGPDSFECEKIGTGRDVLFASAGDGENCFFDNPPVAAGETVSVSEVDCEQDTVIEWIDSGDPERSLSISDPENVKYFDPAKDKFQVVGYNGTSILASSQIIDDNCTVHPPYTA